MIAQPGSVELTDQSKLAGAVDAAPVDEGRAGRLVGGAGSSAMPAWTPDGARVLFHARRPDDKQKGVATRAIECT